MQPLDGWRLLFLIQHISRCRLLYFEACTAVFDHVYCHVEEELANIDLVWIVMFVRVFKVDLMQRSNHPSCNICTERLRLFRRHLTKQSIKYSTPFFTASSMALHLLRQPLQSPILLLYIVSKLLRNARYRCSSSSAESLHPFLAFFDCLQSP